MKVDVFAVGEEVNQGTEIVQKPERGDIAELMPQQPLGIIERAQIDMQIATAKQFPRSVAESLEKAKSLACYSPLIASQCTYSKPQGNKKVTGPSIRLAEIMATSWGNLRYGGRVLSVGERIVTCQGVCHDLEGNVSVSVEVTRSIIDSNKHRYSDSMIVTTSMAGIAIGIRNAIFKVVPGAFVSEIQTAAKKVARGEDQGLEARLTSALSFFDEKGIPAGRVFIALGIKGAADVTWEHIDTLLGYATSIRVEGVPISDIFPNAPTKPAAQPPAPPAPPAPKPAKPAKKPAAEPTAPTAPIPNEQPTPPAPPAEEPPVTPTPEPAPAAEQPKPQPAAPAAKTPPVPVSYTEAAHVLGEQGASWDVIYKALGLDAKAEVTQTHKNKVIAWGRRVQKGEKLEAVLGLPPLQQTVGPQPGEALFGKKAVDAAAEAEAVEQQPPAPGAPSLDF